MFWVKSDELGVGVLKLPADDKLNQCQQPERQTEQMNQALDLVIALDKQRGDGKWKPLQPTEAPFHNPLISVGENGISQGQSMPRCIGDIGSPAAAPHLVCNFGLVARHLLNLKPGFTRRLPLVVIAQIGTDSILLENRIGFVQSVGFIGNLAFAPSWGRR